MGYAITGMSMATIMVGVGIIGLAGIVIKNGILLIEFTDELRGRGYKTRAAAIAAGKIRIIPVMLTALATMLGLLPLAVGRGRDYGGKSSARCRLRHGNTNLSLGRSCRRHLSIRSFYCYTARCCGSYRRRTHHYSYQRRQHRGFFEFRGGHSHRSRERPREHYCHAQWG